MSDDEVREETGDESSSDEEAPPVQPDPNRLIEKLRRKLAALKREDPNVYPLW